MISFQYPWMFALLLLVPALVYLRYARPRRNTWRFSDGEVLRTLPRTWAVRAYWVLPALYAVALTLLVVALARPRAGLAESKTHTEIVDIVLLVDLSTSMRAEDLSTPTERMNRLDAAKRVLATFIDARSNDRMAIIAFAALPYTVSPLTLDHYWLQQHLERLRTGQLEDGTAIGDALASAINRLRKSEAKSKIVILLTDGMQYNPLLLSPETAAQAAKALGVKIYTVGTGKTGMVPVPRGGFMTRQYSEIDEAMLKRIAEITGGTFFRATDFEMLSQVYEQIDAMEKTEIELAEFTRFEERFAPFLLACLALLALEQILSLTRLRRLPS